MQTRDKKSVRVLAVLALGAMLGLVWATPALAQTAKNETVYATLDHDGRVDHIYVVNLLIDEYIDYGHYQEIKNLSTISEPKIEGDKITFPDSFVPGGLYFQGTLDPDNGDNQLPLLFEIRYYLDGEMIAAQDLGGKEGQLRIDIEYLVNEACPEEVRDGLMAQITINLAMDKAINIDAGDANTFLIGNQMSINYMALPGKSGTATLIADVHDFALDPITISLLDLDLGEEIADSISAAEQGFDDILVGSLELVDGSIDLQDGMHSLSEGAAELNNGMDEVVGGGWDFGIAMQEYASGLAEYLAALEALQTGSGQIKTGLDDLADQGPLVAGGVSAIDDGLAELALSGQDLAVLASALLAHPDSDVRALAEGTLQQIGGVQLLSSGLNEASTGVDDYVAGVEEIAGQYEPFDQGIIDLAAGADPLLAGYNELYSGYAEYYAGIKEIGNAMDELDAAISGLPADVQKMVDGQIEFNDGLNDAKSELSRETAGLNSDDLPPVSFTSAEKNNPESVQYMMLTPKIALEEPEPEPEVEDKKDNFFTRLVDLFTKDDK